MHPISFIIRVSLDVHCNYVVLRNSICYVIAGIDVGDVLEGIVRSTLQVYN